MSDLILSRVGTPAGNRLAVALALMAAVLHAIFGALQKGRHDPWLTRAAIDASYGIIAAPFALFVVPWPEPHMWPIFAGAMVIHSGYKIVQAMTYDRAPFTVVYPVVRGTGPLFTVAAAGMVFNEHYGAVQWAGVALLTAGILGLSAHSLAHLTHGRDTLIPALALAVATGALVAAYTTYDAWGIRATADPFTFLAWFFLIDGLFIPALMACRLATRRHPALGETGCAGGLCRLFFLWRDHAGHSAGPGGRGRRAARNLDRFCRLDWLGRSGREGGAGARRADGADCSRGRGYGMGRLRQWLQTRRSIRW